jgi:hypothetical protein
MMMTHVMSVSYALRMNRLSVLASGTLTAHSSISDFGVTFFSFSVHSDPLDADPTTFRISTQCCYSLTAPSTLARRLLLFRMMLSKGQLKEMLKLVT